MYKYAIQCYLLLSLSITQYLLSPVVYADVVKPALIEIIVYTDETCKVEIRTSIEALITGINSRYKNTKDSPNAEKYDQLRILESRQLMQKFKLFEHQFIKQIKLSIDKKVTPLQLKKVEIPLPGYTKVPRTSIITLSCKLPRSSKELVWYYPGAFGDNAVRVRQVNEKKEKWHWSQWQWLRDDQSSKAFSLNEVFTRVSLFEVIQTYITSGFEHILPKGLDHILFILGIFLFSSHLKPLLWQVTMFTIAHTITLGLSINGLMTLPANIVEPLIALSIAYIGFENILCHCLHRSRLLIVFIFGLLHGLGFASVLADFGMPEDDFMVALISFNIGVEFGQLAIITIAYFLVAFWFKDKPWYKKIVVNPASLLIALTGLYWCYDRFDPNIFA